MNVNPDSLAGIEEKQTLVWSSPVSLFFFFFFFLFCLSISGCLPLFPNALKAPLWSVHSLLPVLSAFCNVDGKLKSTPYVLLGG